MIDKVSKKECVLCGACVQVCPQGCISFSDEYCSFVYPKINYSACVKCERCEKVCPSLNKQEIVSPIQFLAAKNKEEHVLKISSSGGFFYALSQNVISMGGYVCGAIFDDEFEVKHMIISEERQIAKLCGSKYTQSDMNDCFSKIKELLKNDKLVLFCGSSCQTAALTSFLGKTYQNLLLLDFICHGVVSSTVFSQYKKYLEKKYRGNIISFQFRNKEKGWLVSGPRVEFDNGKVYTSPLFKDLYMQGYFKNLNLKEACYTCKYKNYHSTSDITIGDFWGIEKKHPKFYDYNGNSAVVVNTLKGKKYLEKIKSSLEILVVEKDDILAENEGLERAFSCDYKLRETYFRESKKKGYIKPLEKYLKKPLWKKIIKRVVRIKRQR